RRGQRHPPPGRCLAAGRHPQRRAKHRRRTGTVTTDAEKWQLEGSAAELYEQYLVPAVTLPWAEDLLDRVGPGPGDRVLDVACGTGVVARAAAAYVGDSGGVVGLDVNTAMLDVARETRSIEWVEGSALALPFGDGEFDVVLCQLGLQFV